MGEKKGNINHIIKTRIKESFDIIDRKCQANSSLCLYKVKGMQSGKIYNLNSDELLRPKVEEAPTVIPEPKPRNKYRAKKRARLK